MRSILVVVACTLWSLTSSAQVAAEAEAGRVDPAFAAALFAAQEVSATTPTVRPFLPSAGEVQDIRRARWRIAAGSTLLATTTLSVILVESSDCGNYGDYDKAATRLVTALVGVSGLVLTGAGAWKLSRVPQATREEVRTSVGQRFAIGVGSFLLGSIAITTIGLTSFQSQSEHYGCIHS